MKYTCYIDAGACKDGHLRMNYVVGAPRRQMSAPCNGLLQLSKAPQLDVMCRVATLVQSTIMGLNARQAMNLF